VIAHAGLPVGGNDIDAFLVQLKGFSRGRREVMEDLQRAREVKQEHWGSAAVQDGGPAVVQDATQRLADFLITKMQWPVAPNGKPLREHLELGHRRYLALAVDALIGCLPPDELRNVTQVVASGRASLLTGFAEQVQQAFATRGLEGVPVRGSSGDSRKLAVIRGVGDYVAAAGAKPKRRPLRAGFEMVLRYAEVGDPMVLIPAGYPLDEGWGVRAWHQPELAAPETKRLTQYVDIRLIPMEVVRKLVERKELEWSYKNVCAWSVIPARGIVADPPFTAQVAYDFLTLRVHLDVEGAPVQERGAPIGDTAGRLHPVHGMDENWFDAMQRRSS
jgi:hypothetical protein